MEQGDKTADKVNLTLQIEPQVYEAFLRKARQADLDVETFLANTLTIVLGCRAFNDKFASAPPKPVETDHSAHVESKV